MKKFRFAGQRSPRNDAFCVLFFKVPRVDGKLSIRLIFIIIAFVVAKKARRGKWSSIGETEERERDRHTHRERTINKKR